MSLCFPLINSMKVSSASISISLPYFRLGIFGLTKTSHDVFWFKHHMLTVPPPPFSTLVILVTTSWAFEAVIRHLRYSNQCSFSLWPIVSFSMVSIFSLVKTLKFSLKSLIFLDILMTSDMLSTFLGWTIFVEISSLTKSTFGLGTAECNTLRGETLLIASAKSYILNGFKLQFFSGSNLFFGEASNGFPFFLSGQNLLDWNLNHLSFLVFWFYDRSFFCYLFKYYPKFVEWILSWLKFLHSSLMIEYLLPERLWYCKGWRHPDL